MDSSRSRTVGKRGYEQSLEVNDEGPQSKMPKLPALARYAYGGIHISLFCPKFVPFFQVSCVHFFLFWLQMRYTNFKDLKYTN